MDNEKKTEKTVVSDLTDEQIRAMADIAKDEEDLKNENKFKRGCRKVRNWMSDHPFTTAAIGIATGGILVVGTLLVVSAVTGGNDDEDSIDIDVGDGITDIGDDLDVSIDI